MEWMQRRTRNNSLKWKIFMNLSQFSTGGAPSSFDCQTSWLILRRSALLAHALDIILRCPHHFTLINILLDVSLQHDLYHESCILLHWLLRVAISPGTGSTVPLCHPAHSNYLVDLYEKWKGAGRPTSVLIRILTETLVETARPELWGCKALGNFARELHNQDFTSLLDLAGQLVTSIANVEPHENDKRPRQIFVREETSLSYQLNKWINYSPIPPPNPQDWSPRLEFLERCRQSGVYKNTDSLAATVVCWATHYLSVATPNPDTHASICRLLRDVSPTVTTYNLLVEMSFGVKQTLQDSRIIIQTYSACLRAEDLLILEASLWACVLRFVETSMYVLGYCGARKEISLYREELMDLVENAEHRCFSGRGLPEAAQARWRWEEIPGCWVQCQSPAAKKAKHHHEPEQRPVERRDPPFTPSRAAIPIPGLHIEDAKAGGHHYAPSLTSSFELSFRSLVSSALSNRTKLHGRSGSSKALFAKPPTVPHRRVVSTLLPPYEVSNVGSERENFDVPASDDALDLFLYPGSSPAPCIY